MTVVADAAGLDRTRLLQWPQAFTRLSAARILALASLHILEDSLFDVAGRALGAFEDLSYDLTLSIAEHLQVASG